MGGFDARPIFILNLSHMAYLAAPGSNQTALGAKRTERTGHGFLLASVANFGLGTRVG